MPRNFYPRPPRGGATAEAYANIFKGVFLSTPSARRATVQLVLDFTILWISIHALREGDFPHRRQDRDGQISIHALREGGDLAAVAGHGPLYISIHALREEGDEGRCSTRSPSRNFYPRPPRGGRPTSAADEGSAPAISIHALREEGDLSAVAPLADAAQFLSTPSARRGDKISAPLLWGRPISIHALREEGDRHGRYRDSLGHISIHALREGATHAGVLRVLLQQISIHALRGGRRLCPAICGAG